MIQLQTLGDTLILVGNREVRPTSPAMFAALLYLGVERGQKVNRVALQELLFPDTDERSGSHSLRQLLYKLRNLGAEIQAEGDVVWLAAEDVSDDYSAPAPTSTSASTNGSGSTFSYSANAPGRFEFLGGYVPKVSRQFDEWLEARRASIGASIRKALIKRMLARRTVADWDSVERIAQDVLSTDAFNEEATLALAEATALNGSKSEAIRILERYESETGRSDLKLPAQILRKRIAERLPDRRRRALDTPFIGRDAEAEAMRHLVVNLRAGDGATVVVSGEPGIGKTRLVDETAALAVLEGVTVHTVRCQPHYATRPMGVFIEWVPMLLKSRGALGVSPESLEQLKRITSVYDDDASRASDAREDVAIARTLVSAIRDLVDAVASEAPILLLVEDAHWADPTSLLELCVLLEKRASRGLLCVFTTRSDEPLRAVGAISERTELVKLRSLSDLDLATLGRHLLGTALADTAPEGFLAWCARVADGNPLHMQMICGHYESTGQPFEVPPTIRATIARRFGALPDAARQLVEVAALLGKHSNLDALRSILGTDNATLLRLVRELEYNGHLAQVDSTAQIRHAILKDFVFDSIPPLTRQALSATIAAYLEDKYKASHDASLLWDCTELWLSSGSPSRAVALIIDCSEHLLGMGRARDSLSLLSRARALNIGSGEQLSVLRHQMLAARAAGDWNLAMDLAVAASALAEKHGEQLPWDIAFGYAEATWCSTVDAAQTIRRMDALSSAPDSRGRIHAAYLRFRVAHEQLDAQAAREAFESVQSLLDTNSTDGVTRIFPLAFHSCFGDRDTAATLALNLAADLRTIPLPGRLRVARNTVMALSILGRLSQSLALAAEYYGVVSELELAQWQYDLASQRCAAFLGQDNDQEAALWWSVADKHRSAIGSSFVDFSHLVMGIEIAINADDAHLARQRLTQLCLLPVAANRFAAACDACEYRIRQMNAAYAVDETEMLKLERLADDCEQSGFGDFAIHAYCEALVRDGRRDDARRRAQRFVRSTRRDPGLPPRGLVAIAEGA